MCKYASDELLVCLLGIFNTMLETGCLEPTWCHAIFTLLPKQGDTSDVCNWRPIAELKISYKIVSRMLHSRLARYLDTEHRLSEKIWH